MGTNREHRDRSSHEAEFGPFRLLVRLGMGGMGEVWKAHGPGPDSAQQVVVVKRILTHLAGDPEVERSFLREVRLSQRLRHPNIVRVFGGGLVSDALYLSMEHLEGVDLYRVLRALKERGITPPVGLGAQLAREVCRALAYAYSAPGDDGLPLRLVHRDVTPTNIMITVDGQVKLLDFGLAKALSEISEGSTKTGTLKGKFGYMAPEQIDGQSARHHSDQFSIGVVLHEALTGGRLFRGEHDVQTIFNVKCKQVDAPSSVNSAVPAELDQICLRALARDPRARFRDCAAMATALDAVVDGLDDGPAQLAALVRDLFPSGVAGVRLALPTSIPKHATVVREGTTTRAKSWRRWWLATLALAGTIALAGWGLFGSSEDRASSGQRPAGIAPSLVAPSSTATADHPNDPVGHTGDVAKPAPTLEQGVALQPSASSTRPTPVRAPATRVRAKSSRPAGSGSNGLASQRAKPGSITITNKQVTPSSKSRDEIRQGAVVDPFAPSQ